MIILHVHNTPREALIHVHPHLDLTKICIQVHRLSTQCYIRPRSVTHSTLRHMYDLTRGYISIPASLINNVWWFFKTKQKQKKHNYLWQRTLNRSGALPKVMASANLALFPSLMPASISRVFGRTLKSCICRPHSSWEENVCITQRDTRK